MITQVTIAGLKCQLYLPKEYENCSKRYPVIYVNGEIPIEEILEELKQREISPEFLMLSIKPHNWNDDFTPWSVPAFREGEQAPLGKADEYIQKLSGEIKLYIDANYRTKKEPENSILIGYSLGGLAALYTLYKTDTFGKVGSLSGSLWYDDWIHFMKNNIFEIRSCKVYLSLGKKESRSRNTRMSKVAECTEKATEILKEQLESENVTFEWNNGGHFTEIPKRFANAISWLL